MAYISSEIFMSDYISLMDINNRETKSLKLVKNKAYDAVYCGNYCAFRIKEKNNCLQLYFRKTYEELLKEHEIDFEILSSKNDYFTLRVNFTYREYINEKRKFFVEMQDDLFMTANKDDTFSCCYLYKQCSDAMDCVSDTASQKYMCKYYRNLRCGKIFYGERSVLDEKHHIIDELVQRNKDLMGIDEVYPIVIEGGEQLEIPGI